MAGAAVVVTGVTTTVLMRRMMVFGQAPLRRVFAAAILR